MLKGIKRIIREVWDNTSFRSYNIIRNIGKGGIITAILIPGIVLCFFHVQAENRELYLQEKVSHAIYEEWKEKDGDVYLDAYITVKKFPFIFGKQENIDVVTKIINTHNYVVRARRNNRAAGLYEENNPKQDYRVELIYYDEIMGREAIRLKSENLKDTRTEKGEKLPLRE